MGNTNYQYSKIVQEVENNISQNVLNVSDASCTNIENGGTYVIDIGDIVGNITFAQLCTISGQAVIDNAIDIQVDAIIDSLQKQAQKTDTFLFQANVNTNVQKQNVRQEIRNNLLQTTLNSCNQTLENVRNGNSYVIRSNSLKGDINFIQKGDVSTDCFITNISKIVAFNKLKAEQSQDQAITVGFGNYFIIIAIVAAVVIIGIVVFFFFTNKPSGSGSNVRVVDTRTGQPPIKQG